ncbi:MAG: HAMP domain-containing histidine kinase [Prevotella sp.]|nr:HAMP domain-containing histidine kinase [Prevotella sp.]
MSRRVILIICIVAWFGIGASAEKADYKTDKTYLELRDSMHHAFNDADSARFFPAVKNLEDYLLQKNDLHAYYTQRCNEIVFQLNRQKIYEAYILGRDLSMELREKKLDNEMYMAYNMLGHLNRYCGNKAAARRNFKYVIEQMEKYGYYESMPPIYMNLVNVEMEENPEYARELLEKALEISKKYSPERVFDIETRKTLTYFNSGDIEKFLEGYEAYRKGVEEGQSSVHGRSIEVYYLACTGKIDEAIALAKKELGEDSYSAITMIYETAGQWKEAYESLRKETAEKDSANNVVLINSMAGVREQLTLHDVERKAAHNRTIAFSIGILLLGLLVAALSYIILSRRRHMKQLKKAYDHALESDRMKTAFIKNVSHEVRTPLNIISGFAQVISNPDLASGIEDRQKIADMMQKNARIITSLIDEMLELSNSETAKDVVKEDQVELNKVLRDLLQENKNLASKETVLRFESSLNEDYVITTNKMMLKRIVSSLVDNAIKNTSKGAVTLKVAADKENLTLIVEDTGKGIPANEAEHIFERFFKIDSFKEGLGLGLPLCRSMTERLGGTVRLDTEYKTGARFIVTLPL